MRRERLHQTRNGVTVLEDVHGKTGFHRRGVAWSFNADHQPIGGKFDGREDALARQIEIPHLAG